MFHLCLCSFALLLMLWINLDSSTIRIRNLFHCFLGLQLLEVFLNLLFSYFFNFILHPTYQNYHFNLQNIFLNFIFFYQILNDFLYPLLYHVIVLFYFSNHMIEIIVYKQVLDSLIFDIIFYLIHSLNLCHVKTNLELYLIQVTNEQYIYTQGHSFCLILLH